MQSQERSKSKPKILFRLLFIFCNVSRLDEENERDLFLNIDYAYL